MSYKDIFDDRVFILRASLLEKDAKEDDTEFLESVPGTNLYSRRLLTIDTFSKWIEQQARRHHNRNHVTVSDLDIKLKMTQCVNEELAIFEQLQDLFAGKGAKSWNDIPGHETIGRQLPTHLDGYSRASISTWLKG
jgi:hypothetical protein